MIADSLLASSREGIITNSESSVGGTSAKRNDNEQTALKARSHSTCFMVMKQDETGQ